MKCIPVVNLVAFKRLAGILKRAGELQHSRCLEYLAIAHGYEGYHQVVSAIANQRAQQRVRVEDLARWEGRLRDSFGDVAVAAVGAEQLARHFTRICKPLAQESAAADIVAFERSLSEWNAVRASGKAGLKSKPPVVTVKKRRVVVTADATSMVPSAVAVLGEQELPVADRNLPLHTGIEKGPVTVHLLTKAKEQLDRELKIIMEKIKVAKRVRVFAPIRSEAFHAAAQRVAEAQLNTCAQVVYSKDTLETIVRLNMAIDLEAHRQAEFPAPSPETLAALEKIYFGGKTEYVAIGNARRAWVSEIVRFSMERPRELMMIGAATSRDKCPNLVGMSPTAILGRLHGTLPEVLKPFLQFIVGGPVADHLRAKVFPFIRSNVLSYQELQGVQASASAAGSVLDHPVCKLYSLGLIGDVMTMKETGEQIQRFRFSSAGRMDGPSAHLPSDSSFFIVHPVLASVLSTINVRPDHHLATPYRKNEGCPIGDELPWSTLPLIKAISLTLHP